MSLVLVLNQFFSYSVFADEITVSGNGEGSSNNVQVEEKKSDSVTQSNNAEVENKVSPEASTGNNKANDNDGETATKTGDADTEAKVVNQVNDNKASGGCNCPQGDPSSATISGNGANTDNSIKNTGTSNTTISQNNGAKITNNIKVTANTGNNEAEGNSGDTTIKTGDVKIAMAVVNKGNSSYVSFANKAPEFNSKIAGNGEGSKNDINNESNYNQQFLVNNYLELNNNFIVEANTGGNKAKDNNGKVFISTGSVLLDIILKNDLNKSVIIADCGCKEAPPSPTPTPTPSGTPSPSSPPSGGSGGSGGGSGGGSSSGGGGSSGSSSTSSSGGQVLGAILPATGGFSILSLTLLASILLLVGIMLRLDYSKAKSYIEYFNFHISAPFAIYLLAFFKSLSLSRQAHFARARELYIYPQDFGIRAAY